MASIAVLPILIGLGVDYAIQFQARFDEAEASGLAGAEAARAAASSGGPTIATAGLATAAGFLALQLSPTPMVRSFGLLLVVGVLIAFLLALTVGFAALSLRQRGAMRLPGVRRNPARERGSLLGRVAPAGGPRTEAPPPPAGHRTRPPERPRPYGTRPPQRLVSMAVSRPRLVLGVGLALAIIGWALGTQIETVSDIRSLAPQNLAAIRNLNELQETTGVSGELDVSVEAPDLTDPATIEWMAAFKRRVLGRERVQRRRPELPGSRDLPRAGALGLPHPRRRSGHPPGHRRDPRRRSLPTRCARSRRSIRETGEVGHPALISFGIRAQSLEDQQALIDRVRAEIGDPGSPGGPAGRAPSSAWPGCR